MKSLSNILAIAVLAVVSAGCSPSSGDKEKVYDIKGKIVSVDSEKKTVRLDHEDIPGHMQAMEMDFDVQESKILTGLKPGDQVQGKFKLKDSNRVIIELQKR